MAGATKWGIASAGLISHDFTNAIGAHSPAEHKVVAVAARSLADAQSFAARHGIETAYGDYSALATDPEVEVVYVGAINTTHLSLARQFLAAGKAVLCEKPLCMTLDETEELVSLARSSGTFLMEAIWSRCLPVYQAVREEVAAGTVGQVKQVIATFGDVISAPRMHQKALGGGTILDLGIYTIQAAQLVFGGEEPVVTAAGQLGEDGCDESASITLTYSAGRTATLLTHSRVKLPNEAVIVGTKGKMVVRSPMWTSTELELPNGQVRTWDLPTGAKHSFNFTNSANMAHESAHVRACLLAGSAESPLLPLQESLTIARIMETARKQIGVRYPQDK